MDHKQKMMAIGGGAAAMLLLTVLAVILLVNACGTDTPSQTAAESSFQPLETTLPPETQPSETTLPQLTEPPATDASQAITFRDVNESVTAKIRTNLRDIPSQGDGSTVLYTLQNGEWITRTGISDSGWSRLERGGVVYYAVSSYLTTDPNYSSVTPEEEDDGINTVFTAVNDRVTAKEVVNLRSIPSVTREDSVVVAQLTKGEWITRTGINTDVGWSRVEYNGRTLYCITSYLETENAVPEETEAPTQ